MSVGIKGTRDVAECVKQEKIWRRKVFEALERLLDPVNEQELRKQLPYLDCSTWDELIEERYIGKLCGYPLCSATLLSKSTQRYHIDKKNKKVYEMCKERSKFCGEHCFQLSCSIRCQLFPEPLWQTGETQKRMSKEFNLNELVIPEKQKDTVDSIELVEDKMVFALNDLRVVEKDGSTDEDIGDEEKHEMLWENENDGSSKSVKRLFFHSTESTVHFPSSEKAYELGKYSTERAINSEINNTEKHLPDHQQSRKLKLTKDETCKLKRLSEKYSKVSHVKRPAIIEVPLIYTRKAQETTMDNELQSNESYLMLSQNQSDVHTVATLFSGWLTERSRDLVRLGRRQPVGEMNIIWKKFFMGEAFSEDDEDNILLPDIDLVDVKKKQLCILLQATKPTWFNMEHYLGVWQSRVEDFIRLVTSFNLQPDTIMGFSKAQCKLISIVAWRIICRLDSELEEAFFPGELLSDKISDYLRDNGIIESNYIQVVNAVLERI